MSLTLTPDELVELTGRKRADAQAGELEHMGIPYSARRDGSLVVLRSVVEHLLGAEPAEGTMARAEPEVQPCRS